MIQIRCYDQGRDDAIIEPEKYQNFYIEYDQIVPDKIASYCFNLFKTDVDKLYLRSRRELKRKCKHRTELTKLTVLHSQLKEHGRFATPVFFNPYSRHYHPDKPWAHVVGNGRMLISSNYAPNTPYDFVHYTEDHGDKSVIERLVDELGKRQERKDYCLVNCLMDREKDVYYANTVEFYSDGKDHSCYSHNAGSWLREVELQLESVSDAIIELITTMPRTCDDDYRAILNEIVSLPYTLHSEVLYT